MQTMTVVPLDGDRYEVDVRGHRLQVDQPVDAGGTDAAPSPTEVFLAGLAACVAHYAGRFCDRHQVPREGLAVELDWAFAPDRPARVGTVLVRVRPPVALPADRRDRFLAVARGCTVHHTLEDPPQVSVDLAEELERQPGESGLDLAG